MLDLGKLSAAAQIVKDIHAMLLKLESVKQNSDLCDKLEEILGLRMTLIDAKEEIVDLREKLAEFNKHQDIERRLKFDPRIGVYFLDDDTENHAYCTKCWSEHSRLVPMRKSDEGYFCDPCTSFYKNPDHRSSPAQIAPSNFRRDGIW
jgi:hypothetical protein